MNEKIIFFEPNESFAERLMDYWADHGLTAQIYYYSDVNKWRQDCREMSVDLYILDCSLRTEDYTKPPNGQVLWWSEREDDPDAIFKYCSAAVILGVIQGYLSKGHADRMEAGAKLISLYSPVKRCLQTTFGLSLAHVLSTKGRTLYLNLEGYSGLDRMLRRSFSKDISDFIYYVNQSSGEIPIPIQNFIHRLGDVDMIPPVLNPGNLQDITEDMWKKLMSTLKKGGQYDYILVDVSDFLMGTFAILRESSVIFSMVKTEAMAEAKWQQYCNVLEEAGYKDILEKTMRQEVPYMVELPVNLTEYIPGEMTNYVKQAAVDAGLI